METNSSGEELVVKARKPYTITKQREKWTEEEHNKFIEALKLHGRAWQRIEEHIGTKTAVQIRSHAQKFFTKLEKEAAMKGVPFGLAHDLEIPPPRPKRKPSSPYPRKTGAVSLSPSVEAIEKNRSKCNAACRIQGAKDNSEDCSCSEVLNLFHDSPAASLTSMTKFSSNLHAYSGFMPIGKEIKDKTTPNGSSMSIEVNRETEGNGAANGNCGNGELGGTSITSQMRSAQEEEANKSKQPDKTGPLGDTLQGDGSDTKHVPFDFMKRSDGNVPTATAAYSGGHANAKLQLNLAVPSSSEMNTNSGISSIDQSFPGFPSFIQISSNQDAYGSLLAMPSTFLSIIVSTLLQNPAVHAAACVAASLWPSAGLEASVNSSSESIHGGIPTRTANPAPSMAVIAAATVAAASAWWASQGLLPIYPLHAGFAFAPPPPTVIPTVDAAQDADNKKDYKADLFEHSVGIDQQDRDPQQFEVSRAQYPSHKSSSLFDSDESSRGEVKDAKANKFKPLSGNLIDDSDKARNKKKLNPSSCGSNTPSSSEVETYTDAVPKKQDGNKDDPKQVHANNNPRSGETNNRQSRSSSSTNDPWKEVSEEVFIQQTILVGLILTAVIIVILVYCLLCQGRLAFHALFNSEMLPQSFSPPQPKVSMVMTGKDEEAANELPVDLNLKVSNEPTGLYYVQGLDGTLTKGSLTSEISHAKLTACRTGFKPYKRCSVEANESRATVGDETANKRIRLEGEASI